MTHIRVTTLRQQVFLEVQTGYSWLTFYLTEDLISPLKTTSFMVGSPCCQAPWLFYSWMNTYLCGKCEKTTRENIWLTYRFREKEEAWEHIPSDNGFLEELASIHTDALTELVLRPYVLTYLEALLPHLADAHGQRYKGQQLQNLYQHLASIDKKAPLLTWML